MKTAKKITCLIQAILLSTPIFCGSALAESPKSQSDRPKIEKIEGGKIVSLLDQEEKRSATEGMELEYGQTLKTDPESSATVLYPDGSRIVIAANSEYKLDTPANQSQWGKLQQGSVRGIIEKAKESGTGKPKFVIRTKAAVLGVRGTDFVMAMNPANGTAQVNTLEGTVEVARSELSVLEGKGQMIEAGQFIQASPSGLGPVQAFDADSFLKEFKAKLNGPLSEKAATPPTPSPPPGTGSSGLPASVPAYNGVPPASIPMASKPAPPSPPPMNAKLDDPRVPPPINIIEEEKRKVKLISFEFSFLFTNFPNGSILRAVGAAWNPTIPFPLLPFFTIAPYLGINFAQDFSLYKNLSIIDYELFLIFTLLKPLYFEGGFGKQFWTSPIQMDAEIATINVGLYARLGPIDRIYGGVQVYNSRPDLTRQFHVGVGIGF